MAVIMITIEREQSTFKVFMEEFMILHRMMTQINCRSETKYNKIRTILPRYIISGNYNYSTMCDTILSFFLFNKLPRWYYVPSKDIFKAREHSSITTCSSKHTVLLWGCSLEFVNISSTLFHVSQYPSYSTLLCSDEKLAPNKTVAYSMSHVKSFNFGVCFYYLEAIKEKITTDLQCLAPGFLKLI